MEQTMESVCVATKEVLSSMPLSAQPEGEVMVTVEATEVDWSRTLRRRGALVLAPFALLWALVAISGLPAGSLWAARVVASVITVAALFLLVLTPSGAGARERVRHQPDGWHKRVGVVNLAEFAAIVLTVVIFAATGVPELVPPIVCLIVGLHFVPLARLFDQPEYRGTAIGLGLGAFAGLAVLALGPSQEVSRIVVGAFAACTLWATSARLSMCG
jgi:hypothetical protein